jgi:hypothetical protein
MEHGRTRISIVAATMIPDVLPTIAIDIGGISPEAAGSKH